MHVTYSVLANLTLGQAVTTQTMVYAYRGRWYEPSSQLPMTSPETLKLGGDCGPTAVCRDGATMLATKERGVIGAADGDTLVVLHQVGSGPSYAVPHRPLPTMC